MVDMNSDGKLDVVEGWANGHTRSMLPLTALQYLAAGKPVVSRPLPALSVYGEHVRLAARADRFVAEFDAACSRPTPQRPADEAFAAGQSWEERLELISRLVEQTRGAQLQPPRS